MLKRKSVAVKESDLRQNALICGYLEQKKKATILSSSNWKPGFVLLELQKGEGGAVLQLQVYDVHPTSKELKFGYTFELEEGCEVRELKQEDAPDKVANCFMIVTSKTQLKFHASSESECRRWIVGLSKEFDVFMESKLNKQKAKLLKQGTVMSWYRGGKLGIVKECKVWLSNDGGSLCLNNSDCCLKLTNIDCVLPGNDSSTAAEESFRSVFHFNCFVIKLKVPTNEFGWNNCTTLDFECAKQSTRDSFVSALESLIKSESPSTPSPKSPQQLLLDSTTGGVRNNRSETIEVNETEDDDDDDDVDEKPSESNAGGGVKEMFKQKAKVNKRFPYSRCISHAIAQCVNKEEVTLPKKETPIQQRDMDEVKLYAKLEILKNEQDAALDGKKKKQPARVKFEMSDYAPNAFKELRHRFGVTDGSYLKSLAKLSGDGAVGDGKSGMLFFFTQDRRFVLKTVKPNEMSVLTDTGLLNAYIIHMCAYPDSLICRFFGLYRFKMGGSEIFLVCMQNSFDTRLVLHEKYDLKGSTRNRWCTPRFGSVLKDLNFGNNKLYLDSEERVDFLKQAERDTELLEKFNVMDYSLLLGVHKPKEADVEKLKRNLVLLGMADQVQEKSRPKPTRWQRDFGGVQSFDQETKMPVVYIMCIIDILQAYDLGKKAEHLIKSRNDEEPNEISAVNPKTYRTRFIGYLSKITVGVNNNNAAILESTKQIKLMLANIRMSNIDNNVRRSGNSSGVQNERLESVGEDTLEERGLIERAMEEVNKNKKKTIPMTAPKSGNDELKEEIERAVKMAEQEKLDIGADNGFTEVLDDGTEITIFEEGGFLQRNMDGVTIRQFKDGSIEQTNPNGSTIFTDKAGVVTHRLADGTVIQHVERGGGVVVDVQKNPDGSTLEHFQDGSSVQTNADGSKMEIAKNGDRRFVSADGLTVIENLMNGTKIQKQANGITIITDASGKKIQTDASKPHVMLTVFPDGTVEQDDSMTGVKIVVKGEEEQQIFPDGVRMVKYKNKPNYSKQYNVDGSILEVFPDKTTKLTKKKE